MIEGTRTYRRKNSETDPSEEIASSPAEQITATTEDTISDAVNKDARLDRRAWFSALVPALGDGLVQILRASNNLKRDLSDAEK